MRNGTGSMTKKDYVIPCSCHDFHFLRFTSWPEDDKNSDFLAETYLSIGGDFWHSWKDRIKGAWHVLSGKHAHSCEVLLDREGAVRLRNILEKHLHVIGYELPPHPPRPAFPPRQDDSFGGLL